MTPEMITPPNAIDMSTIGRGIHAADGSSVEFYRLLKASGEPEIIRSILAPGASILELGSGAGRITHSLLEMGFPVVAVDNSPAMLAEIRGAETVCSDIETLHLDRTFDAVLLMSHLINTPDVEKRQQLLATCRRHVAPSGVAIFQRYDPQWLDEAAVGPIGSLNGIGVFLDAVSRIDRTVTMILRYESETNVWTHSFTAERLDDDDVVNELTRAGLGFGKWLDDSRTWFSAADLPDSVVHQI